jgi:STE24 endopeptidase
MLLTLMLAAGGGAGGEEPGPLTPAEREALKHFTPEDVARGRTRARQSATLLLLGFAWSVIVLAALAHPTVGAPVVSLARGVFGAGDPQATPSAARALGAAALAITITLAAYFVLRMPLAWARGYFLEHAWDLSKQTAGAFFWDWTKGFLVSVLVYGAALFVVMLLRSRLPTWWPVAAWGATSVLILLYVFLMPVVVDPLFAKFTPVSEPEVLERVNLVARKAGLDVGEVLWSDASSRTRRVNACFTGLGATKRIVLWDTLRGEVGPDGRIRAEALDELEVILAHEAGHWRRGHMWKGTLLGLLGVGGFFLLLWLIAGVGARGGSSWLPSARLPEGARAAAALFLTATLIQFLAMPVACAVSRSMERDADSDSLDLTGKHAAYVRTHVELARRNVANITPSRLTVFWLYTHPPVLERIAAAEGRVFGRPPRSPTETAR